MKKRIWLLCAAVVACCAVMAVVDAVLQPPSENLIPDTGQDTVNGGHGKVDSGGTLAQQGNGVCVHIIPPEMFCFS